MVHRVPYRLEPPPLIPYRSPSLKSSLQPQTLLGVVDKCIAADPDSADDYARFPSTDFLQRHLLRSIFGGPRYEAAVGKSTTRPKCQLSIRAS